MWPTHIPRLLTRIAATPCKKNNPYMRHRRGLWGKGREGGKGEAGRGRMAPKLAVFEPRAPSAKCFDFTAIVGMRAGC